MSIFIFDFSGDEVEAIKKVIAEADQAIITLIGDGLETAMNKFNRTNAPELDKPETLEKDLMNPGTSKPVL